MAVKTTLGVREGWMMTDNARDARALIHARSVMNVIFVMNMLTLQKIQPYPERHSDSGQR